MGVHKIVIAGPPSAEAFLKKLASAILPDHAEIDLQLGLAAPTDLLRPDLPVGYEGIDVEAARHRGIAFANGRVAENFESVAEAAMLFMLTALYRLRDAEDRLRRGEARSGPPRARMLKGKTVGIIGYGNIAKALISRLAGWDARILVSNRSKLSSSTGVAQCDLDTLIAEGLKSSPDIATALSMRPHFPTPRSSSILARSRSTCLRPSRFRSTARFAPFPTTS